MLTRIISGGQTGADRAALDAALALSFPIGGSCPVGRMAEDGPLAERYALDEIGGGYRQRTRMNVVEACGTAIFYASYLSGGTEATVHFCIRQKKPYKLIDIELVDPARAADILGRFVCDVDIGVLNVAGPRESLCPGIYDHVRQTLSRVLEEGT